MIVIRLVMLMLLVAGCTGKNSPHRLAASPADKRVQAIRNGNMTITSKYLSGMNNRKDRDVPVPDSDNYRLFNIRFDKNGTPDMAREKILYTAFDMQQDFTLVTGRDSVMPAICQKIENGLGGSYEYLVAFEGAKQPGDFRLVYRDKIFGIGTIAFIYNQGDMDKIPGLN